MKNIILIFLLVSTFTANAYLPSDYQNQSAKEKSALIWANIESTEYELMNLELPKFSFITFGLNAAKALDPIFVRKSFTTSSDEMPVQKLLFSERRRPKIIHSFGTAALVKFVPVNTPKFTGIFSKESIGLARISTAAPGSFTPGMAVKFYVDGKPSVNIQVMHSLTFDEKSCNPFGASFTNIIPPASGFLKLAAVTFEKIAGERGGRSNHLTVDHLAEVNESNPVSPYKIVLAPTKLAKELGFDCKKEDYRKTIKALSPGDTIYEIFGNSKENGKFEKLGDLVLDSGFIASKYADDVLFFQHDIRKK